MSKNKIREQVEQIKNKYGLDDDNIFVKEHKTAKDRNGNPIILYKIIDRAGIDLIEKKSNCKLEWSPLYISDQRVYLRFDAYDPDGNLKVATTGEASAENVDGLGKYYLAMAEKRGRSRALLKYEGLYDEGFFGEDEADDFSNFIKQSRDGRKQTRTEIKV